MRPAPRWMVAVALGALAVSAVVIVKHRSAGSDHQVASITPSVGENHGYRTVTLDGVDELVTFSDDSQLFSIRLPSGDGVELRDADTGLVRSTLHGTRGTDHLVFSPDSTVVTTSDSSGEVKVWAVATGKRRYTLGSRSALEDKLAVVGFSADSSQLFLNVDHGRGLRAVAPRTGKTLRDVALETPEGCSMINGLTDVDPTHAFGLIRVYGNPPGVFDQCLWELATGHARPLAAKGKLITATPGGDVVVTQTDAKGPAEVRNVTNGDTLRTLPLGTNDRTLTYSTDGRFLATIGDSPHDNPFRLDVTVWNLASGMPTGHLAVKNPGNISAALVDDGAHLVVVGGASDGITIYDVATGTDQTIATPAHYAVRTAPNGKRFATLGRQTMIWSSLNA